MISHLKREHAIRLARRRPNLFAGLEGWNPKQHVRLLNASSPYASAVLFRLWSGAIVCAHKRFQVYEHSEVVPVVLSQTVGHLLWDCPLVPPAPDLEYRRHLPASQSVSHTLPPSADLREVVLWRRSCKRAVDILTKVPQQEGGEERDVDLEGHVLGVSENGQYTFCKRCFISRRSRDKKWIWLRECLRKDQEPRSLSEVWEFQGHQLSLSMMTWKITALRPRISREICGGSWRATSGPKDPCLGGLSWRACDMRVM